MSRLYYRRVSDEEWPPPEARARAALWEAERHLARGEYLAASTALEAAVTCGNPSTAAAARGLRLLATAGYRHAAGDPVRAEAHLDRARVRLSPFLPVFEEVELGALLDLVSTALES
jgi:hypothetical protein